MERITIRTYDTAAQAYDQETAGYWEQFPRTFINNFIAEVGSGRVLDIGSGPGRDGKLLQATGLTVVGLDASSSMTHLSAARGIATVQADFLAIPFTAKSFRGAWAYTSLIHVTKVSMPNALREIRRVLEPDGVLGLALCMQAIAKVFVQVPQ